MYATVLLYLAMVTPYYGDLIARQPGMNAVIGEPLTAEEMDTLRKAVWNREWSNITAERERGWQPKIQVPEPHQQMAFDHLQKSGPLRAGDFTVLHGSLLSALQPDTFALAKHWQDLMKCAPPQEADPSCVGY